MLLLPPLLQLVLLVSRTWCRFENVCLLIMYVYLYPVY